MGQGETSPQPADRSGAVTQVLRLRRLDAWALRVAIARPVETSFGIMRDRPAVFVRVEDASGAFGFGEIWCNFPACGAEHRARLAAEEIAPLFAGREFASPRAAFRELSARVHVRVLQTAEPGPYSQAIAGIDTALWDLCARAAGKPLRRLLADGAADAVPAYASGIHVGLGPAVIAEARGRGFRAFKVKVGFGHDADVAGIERVRPEIRPGERLFADANQAWRLEQALDFTAAVREAGLGWLEEPLPADAPAQDWVRLARDGGVPLAAGENMMGEDTFRAAAATGALAFIQPDMAKWGGVNGCLPAARAILASGRTYCPHYLGGGIGLLASANLLAAVGGPGLLEVDSNPNPLRAAFAPETLDDGMFPLADAPGLGVTELPGDLARHVTVHRTWTA